MSAKKKGLTFTDREPWPEPVNGTALLDDLTAAFRRHLVLPSGAAEAMALWVLFAHTHDAHQTSPRLAFLSPVHECGKTTALAILAELVPRPLTTSNISPAVIFRVIEAHRPTLLIDEADTFLHASDDTRGILNSGHSRAAATVWRCKPDTHEPEGYSAWAPVVIAKIGQLPATLESRSVVIAMHRRRPDEAASPICPEDRGRFHELAKKAARWAADNAITLASSDPLTAPGLYNRARDNWRPLLAIADAAGGHWPESARRIATVLSGSAEDPSLGVQLLSDIRDIFAACPVDRLTSETLCSNLNELDDRPWREHDRGRLMTRRQLADLLRPFGVRPDSVRISNRTPKGYMREWFEEAFTRYLSDPPAQSATPQHGSESGDLAA